MNDNNDEKESTVQEVG